MTKHINIDTNVVGEYPSCRNCSNAMVYTFAFRGCEWACLPCDEAEPMWNSRPKVERLKSSMTAKKKKWSDELSVIGRRFGGGGCAVCQDGSCRLCQITNDENYQFKIWKSNLKETLND